VTATREKLLDMAENFEAMGWTSEAADARLAASKLAPPAPDDAPRAFNAGDLVCPVPGEHRAGEVGTVRRETTRANAPVFMVEFPNRDHCAYAAHELTHADAPDDAKLVLRAADYLRQYTMFGGLADQLVDVSERLRTALANHDALGFQKLWARKGSWIESAESGAPRIDAPDDEGLSESDANIIETWADIFDADGETTAHRWAMDIASRIRTALANGAGDSALQDRLGAWRGWSRSVLGISPEPDETLRALINDRLANGAGEVERLRAELARVAREHSTAERASLRAELDEARRELGGMAAKLGLAKGDLDDARMAITQRDAQLDEARREHQVDLATLHKWRVWAAGHGRECLMSDGANRDVIDQKLATAKPERLGRRGAAEWCAGRLEACGFGSSAQALRDLAATLPPDTEPVFTSEDVAAVTWASGGIYSDRLRDLADRLATFVQARGETEAGK
jgi:hypothetical protein